MMFLVAVMNVVQTKPGCSASDLAGMLTIHCRGVSALGRNGGGETPAENQRYLSTAQELRRSWYDIHPLSASACSCRIVHSCEFRQQRILLCITLSWGSRYMNLFAFSRGKLWITDILTVNSLGARGVRSTYIIMDSWTSVTRHWIPECLIVRS